MHLKPVHSSSIAVAAISSRGALIHTSPLPAGMASTALVLSIAAPWGGSAWYGLTALSPVAGYYYFTKGTREEDFQVNTITDNFLLLVVLRCPYQDGRLLIFVGCMVLVHGMPAHKLQRTLIKSMP